MLMEYKCFLLESSRFQKTRHLYILHICVMYVNGVGAIRKNNFNKILLIISTVGYIADTNLRIFL